MKRNQKVAGSFGTTDQASKRFKGLLDDMGIEYWTVSPQRTSDGSIRICFIRSYHTLTNSHNATIRRPQVKPKLNSLNCQSSARSMPSLRTMSTPSSLAQPRSYASQSSLLFASHTHHLVAWPYICTLYASHSSMLIALILCSTSRTLSSNNRLVYDNIEDFQVYTLENITRPAARTRVARRARSQSDGTASEEEEEEEEEKARTQKAGKGKNKSKSKSGDKGNGKKKSKDGWNGLSVEGMIFIALCSGGDYHTVCRLTLAIKAEMGLS
jgi:hypothetical protein